MTLNIGEQIRKHRRALDMTQEQLAERLGVSFQAVSRWENGAAYPDIELLPVLAELFDTSVDKLMGLDEAEKDRQAHQAISDFLNACDENEPIEKLVGMLRGIRRDHIASKHILLLFWGWQEQYSDPNVAAERRKIAYTRLKDYPDRSVDDDIIEGISCDDDEEHALEFVKAYSTKYDMSEKSMLYRRYSLRDDYKRLEPYRQAKIYESMMWFIRWIDWNDRRKPSDINYSYAVNSMQFEVLNSFCGHTPDAKYPISGNGEVDIFVYDRVLLGLRRAAQVVTLGDNEQAFIILEDAVSLLEKLMNLPDGTKLTGTSRFIPDIIATVEHIDKPRMGEFFGGKTARLKLNDGVKVENDDVELRGFLQPFVMPGHWAWFDPIRNDPRFLEYTNRIKALSGDK